ncbi:hypothetical protein LuPra_05506 [Luteitalea pratensis]|uniref:FecR protein n=1 Tax=Luteitalea pratensis TaxID=1855912 RepID=A0A143PVP5_LUTPR|nr:hypothetical protein [Luteitalea pratensis]AMY12233.1 hypothetical protein LuPra_05506 [Luteitalea pratensis]
MEPMDDEYLWDRTGPPDEDVARLEALLAQFAAPSAEEWAPLALPGTRVSNETAVSWRTWLAAAALALISIGTAWLTPRQELPGDPWRVARVEGMPTIAAAPLARHSQLVPGRWLETDARSSAVVFVGRIGRLEVEPGSRLRLVTATPGEHRAELVTGTIQAQIWAPAGQFVIDTPSATAIDLGCAYTLTINSHGVGLITVQGGWVGFEHNGREAFIPAGATGRTYPGRGPGTPTYAEASAALRAAIDTIDQVDDAAAQAAPLETVLREARPEDALTLWHLLDRVDVSLEPLVVDRLSALAPMPPGVTRDGVLAGNRDMRDAWWDALDLGTADWWRTWRQKWNP